MIDLNTYTQMGTGAAALGWGYKNDLCPKCTQHLKEWFDAGAPTREESNP